MIVRLGGGSESSSSLSRAAINGSVVVVDSSVVVEAFVAREVEVEVDDETIAIVEPVSMGIVGASAAVAGGAMVDAGITTTGMVDGSTSTAVTWTTGTTGGAVVGGTVAAIVVGVVGGFVTGASVVVVVVSGSGVCCAAACFVATDVATNPDATAITRPSRRSRGAFMRRRMVISGLALAFMQ